MKITLSHGGGGRETKGLIDGLIKKHLSNPTLDRMEDAAILPLGSRLAFSTDSFVVKPLFFPGGDIGKLAVCGTANDLAMMGARTAYLSLALIIEEGFDTADLERILHSFAEECAQERITLACGDIKVVEKGKGDGIFLNTSGIGIVLANADLSIRQVRPGDVIIVSGNVGEHGAAIMAARKDLSIKSSLQSDCAQLFSLVQDMLNSGAAIHTLRDATRGGVASVANEMGESSNVTVVLREADIPVPDPVRAFCGLLGLDALELANEGKLMAAVAEKDAEKILRVMRAHPLGKNAAIIGRAEPAGKFPALRETALGVRIILEMPRGEHLPRIC
jgi:hydrogenase expression/formation protein HypE